MSTRTRILVTGGRAYSDKERVFSTLDHYLAAYPPLLIIQGGAKGADALAAEWAQRREVPCLTHYASWGALRRAAGMIRNREMAEEWTPRIVIAFPGGTGTNGMVGIAEELSIPVQDMRHA